MTKCHICLTREGTEIFKCKFCCDGLEQELCTECDAVASQWKGLFMKGDGPEEARLFQILQIRRKEGILNLKGVK